MRAALLGVDRDNEPVLRHLFEIVNDVRLSWAKYIEVDKQNAFFKEILLLFEVSSLSTTTLRVRKSIYEKSIFQNSRHCAKPAKIPRLFY